MDNRGPSDPTSAIPAGKSRPRFRRRARRPDSTGSNEPFQPEDRLGPEEISWHRTVTPRGRPGPGRAEESRRTTLPAHRGFRVVSNPSAPENQDEPLAVRAGSGRSPLGDDAVMPMTTETPQPTLRAEHSYREHLLVVTRGSPLPAGATLTPSGINFVLICRHGTAVSLTLSEPCSGAISAEIPLDPLENRTGDHWHIRVSGLPEEFCYGYRVDGPRGNGHRYDPGIILLDPYARAL